MLPIGLELKEHLVSNLKFLMVALPISKVFHFLLCTQQVHALVIKDGIPVFKHLVNQRNRCTICLVTDQWWRISSIKSLERCTFSGRMAISIIPVFRPRKPTRPAAWFAIHKATEISLKTPICYLSLAIRLGMVCCTALKNGPLKNSSVQK